MLIIVALQNLVAYSVNVVDNIMLGGYSQTALSGVTIVNQIFFMVQQITIGIGNALVILASQYWGQKRTEPIRILTGIAMKWGTVFSIVVIAICAIFPRQLLSLFTSDSEILAEGVGYMYIVVWSFVLFILTNTLMSALRSVETVKISFYISVVSLFINIFGNAIFIYGLLGFPEMGARGAALSTVIARAVEFLIILFYIIKIDKKLNLFSGKITKKNPQLRKDYKKVTMPLLLNQILWGLSVPIQTAILGHLSSDAIAANSVASTFYQYLKVVVKAMASTSNVLIGNAIGRGDIKRVKSDARSMAVIDVILGIILALALFCLRKPLLSFYSLSETAKSLAINFIAIYSLLMVGMSFQMPVCDGIISGGGNPEFVLKVNMISFWAICLPLSLAAAFWWNLPVELVVLCVQADQLFKCIPYFLRLRSYKWIRKLTN